MTRLLPTKESFKVGRKKLGVIMTMPSGQKIMVLERSRKAIFLDKEARINDAIDEGVACWSVETLILSKMRSRDITYLAIKVREDGEIFLSTFARFERYSHMRNRRVSNGSPLRSLSFDRFVRKSGRVKLR